MVMLPEEIVEGYRLSPQQEDLWQLQQSQSSNTYRVQCADTVQGEIDAAALRAAVQDSVERCEILRTRFRLLPGMSVPLQQVMDGGTTHYEEFDFSGLTPQRRQAEIDALLDKLQQTPFDFEVPSLLHCFLVKLSDRTHSLLFSLPALCVDRAGMVNLVREIGQGYEAHAQGVQRSNELIQYIQISDWFNEVIGLEEAKPGIDFWQEQLRVDASDTSLIFERQPPQEEDFHPQTCTLSTPLSANLRTLAEASNVGVASVLLACWQVLLTRLTEQPDLLIGYASDGRTDEDLESAIGLFVRHIPFRCPISGSTTFQQLVSQVSESLDAACEWQDCFSEARVVDTNRNGTLSRTPYSFEFGQQPSVFEAEHATFSIQEIDSCTNRFRLKLICLLDEETLNLKLQFDSNRYARDDIERLAAQFQSLLKNAVADPQTPVEQLEIMTEAPPHFRMPNTPTTISTERCIQMPTRTSGPTPRCRR